MRVKLKPHLGVRVNTVLKFEDDIRVHLGLENRHCVPLKRALLALIYLGLTVKPLSFKTTL